MTATIISFFSIPAGCFIWEQKKKEFKVCLFLFVTLVIFAFLYFKTFIEMFQISFFLFWKSLFFFLKTKKNSFPEFVMRDKHWELNVWMLKECWERHDRHQCEPCDQQKKKTWILNTTHTSYRIINRIYFLVFYFQNILIDH